MIVKLLDFGVAKVRKDPSQLDRSKSLTQTGGLLGSPLYMSPEQAIGAKTFDARTDVFSLGVVLYEMLTGRVPHEEHETIGRLIIAICQEPAPHVQDLAPWVPGPIAWIVHKALEIDPGDRYPTALAMLDAIIEALPEGWEIEPSTVTSLSKAEIQTTAPRLELPHARSGTGRSALAATIPIDPSDVPRAAGADRSEGGRDTTVRTRPRARLVTFLSAGLFVALAIAVVIVAAKTAPRPIETRAAIDPKPADSAAVSPPPGASAQPPAPAARPDTSTVAARDDKAGGRPAAPRKQGSLTPAPAPTSGTPSPSPAASTAPAASRKLGTSDSFE
jgi:serine/threonine-protein kinase